MNWRELVWNRPISLLVSILPRATSGLVLWDFGSKPRLNDFIFYFVDEMIVKFVGWSGRRSFNGRCLHYRGKFPNPYEQAISIIGRTLSSFDEDNLIPCFGFGDGISLFLPLDM